MEMQIGRFPSHAGKHGAHHYGKVELRELMDFIFGGPPTCKAEEVFESFRLRNAKAGKWRE